MNTAQINITPGTPPWDVVRDIAAAAGSDPWVLVGGLMTQVHAAMRGYASRATRDVDMLVDLMASQANARTVLSALRELGFEYREPGLRGSAFHRMVKDGAVVDVLVADHLPSGRKSAAKVNSWPMLETPGGAQAISRAMDVQVAYGDEKFGIRVPSLLGALVLKAAAYGADRRDRHRHLEDVALLASLAEDLAGMRAEMRGSDRKRLMKVRDALSDPNEPAWLLLDESMRQKGMDTLRILAA